MITDALMPKVDGRELCRRLKAIPNGATKKVPIVPHVAAIRTAV